MKKQPIEINFRSLNFASKVAAQDHFSRIRDRYNMGQVVTNPDHVRQLTDLVLMRADPSQLIGPGISNFIVAPNPYQAHVKEFRVIHTDGSEQAFSYVKTIGGYHKWREESARYHSHNTERDVTNEQMLDTETLPTMHFGPLGERKMSFGVHSGKTFQEVADTDWQYIEWMADRFELTKPVLCKHARTMIAFRENVINSLKALKPF